MSFAEWSFETATRRIGRWGERVVRRWRMDERFEER